MISHIKLLLFVKYIKFLQNFYLNKLLELNKI